MLSTESMRAMRDAGESLQQAKARGRQVLLMAAIMPKLDMLLEEAAEARIPAPGLLELREWARFNLEENAEIARERLAA